MGPTPDETESLKDQVKELSDHVNGKAVDWSKVATLLSKLLSVVLNAHVK